MWHVIHSADTTRDLWKLVYTKTHHVHMYACIWWRFLNVQSSFKLLILAFKSICISCMLNFWYFMELIHSLVKDGGILNTRLSVWSRQLIHYYDCLLFQFFQYLQCKLKLEFQCIWQISLVVYTANVQIRACIHVSLHCVYQVNTSSVFTMGGEHSTFQYQKWKNDRKTFLFISISDNFLRSP